MHPQGTFSQAWGAQVRNLTGQAGGILNEQNGEWSRRFTGSKAEFAGKTGNFKNLADQFVASLLDDNAPAGNARAVLTALRQLITRPGGQYTSFPTTINNCLLEYINAKLLWQAGTTWPLPGPGIDSAGKEPDYQVSGMPIDQACGDHIRAQSPKTPQDMTKEITKSLNEKLGTYQQPQVRVIIDASESSATQTIGTTQQHRQAWATQVAQATPGVPELARLHEIGIVVDPAVAFTFIKGTDF